MGYNYNSKRIQPWPSKFLRNIFIFSRKRTDVFRSFRKNALGEDRKKVEDRGENVYILEKTQI
jgi:hypothetical protein